ncbi:SDR family oxidoreductase [Ancylobacter dichloromethanicus]|uniref:3-oxoacyl-ACP reductase n=1 Tax=Ancylobacter dichloromethanicus TaxID=518825 RepID=A0A9W6MYL0_9HYPH|nr:SDR family oxidoreductase [Ancylobacter dichloromethanicus]MBS7553954.1 SDR family oxidoreductase [Ancylobacter dichloromethanicus]GLK71065.1 3-oxoacyl-ACP reductase [Ancylobacter dichloromethanicus]
MVAPHKDNPHKDLRVIVTGTASGIGRACADALSAAGAKIIGFDLHPPPDETRWHTILVNVAEETSVIGGMEAAVAELRGLDVIVNCAGICEETPLARFDVAAYERMAAVNVRGPILMAREALGRFSGDGPIRGRIINIASELAYLGRAGFSGYAGTKGAILTLTRSWARELGPDILVNAVAPGPVDTPLLGYRNLSEELKRLETSNPSGRVGCPEEVAQAVLFLASRATSFITGQCLSVDGGAAMH